MNCILDTVKLKPLLRSEAKWLEGASHNVALVLHRESVRVKLFRVGPVLRVKMQARLDQMKR